MTTTHTTTMTLLAAALSLTSACAFTDGDPWGWFQTETRAQGLAIDARDQAGNRVSLDAAAARVSIRLVETKPPSGASGASFDPASPPPGYSLCHNGHCHADSGELVPYDDIRAELASGSGPVETTVARAEAAGQLLSAPALTSPRAPVTVEASVDTLQVELNLTVDARATLDGDEVAVEVITGPVELSAPADIFFGPDAPEDRTLAVTLDWTGVDPWRALDLSALNRSADTIKLTSVVNADATNAFADALSRGRLVLEERP